MTDATRRQLIQGASLLAALPFASRLVLPGAALAQEANYPSRPVRIIVPFSPGGTTDLLARILAERLGAVLNGNFVVENRPGAGGNIGGEVVARAEPDGYTLLMTTIGTAAINYGLYGAQMPYKPQDLAAVSNLANVPNVIIVPANSPVRDLAGLVAKAKKDGVTFGSSGNGTSLHLTGELLHQQAGGDFIHVPYRGSGPMLTDAIAGRVDVAFDNLPSALGHIRDGRLRALAVTSPQRAPTLPDVPTVREAGFPALETFAWFGLQAPARTPRPIIDKLAGAMKTIVADPAARAKLAEQGAEPVGDTPEQFQAFIDAEIARWREVIRKGNIRVD
ncbi:tripartite tricarboxylate transporter substrate binding protein [Roseomonas sp. NAR14]|uniref:Tripartite tricarboxylate transporter substrate binding protein n=1 Tax=Roseomonas acroporae TaxID=2937791 RepID=A0A9X1YD06_9PROT|nr:tripartite tricarboxylate transporter substrate binding protein [Roseomonas acroporae]MCK8786452.1 tripartite tricarboxylate transporter substrate binding protein [Roseomonas acroporae]